jgi:C4-dicarboxylate transporter, DctQ subunit
MLARIVNRLEEGIISLLLVGMTLLVFVEVVLRFGFNMGFLWMQEVTLHLSAWMVLIGASYCLKVGAHIGVDAVIRLVPPGPRRWISMFAGVLCLFYCCLFIYGGWIYEKQMHMIAIELEDVAIERWVVHSVILLGFALLFVRFSQLIWAFATGKATGFRLADEAAEVLKEVEKSELPETTGGVKS